MERSRLQMIDAAGGGIEGFGVANKLPSLIHSTKQFRHHDSRPEKSDSIQSDKFSHGTGCLFAFPAVD